MIKVRLEEAEGHLGRLIEEAAAGQEVLITTSQGPAVRLVPMSREPERQHPPKSVGHSLDRFIGTWSADQEAELLKAVEVFEQVDESFWQ